MKSPKLPDKLDELMAGYVLENLSLEEAEELQQLLESQPERAKELDNLQEILALIPYALPSLEPPQYLEESILQGIEIDDQIKEKFRQKSFFSTREKIAGIISILFLGILGWNNYTLRENFLAAQTEIAHQKDIVSMLQNPKTHLVSLKGMDIASNASGRIIMTPGEPKCIVIIQKLPILPNNKHYQLWSIVNGKKVPSGQFNASKNGTVLLKLPTPPTLEVTQLLITIEASSNPPNPIPGLMVMTSNL